MDVGLPPALIELALWLRGLRFNRPGIAVALIGEAGIGKTWNAEYLARQSKYNFSTVHSGLPFVSLFRQLPRPPRSVPAAARVLTRLERHEEVDPEQVVRAVGRHLEAIAPFVLRVEDMHDTSAERREWWGQLGAVIQNGTGVALLSTSRMLPPRPFEACRVERLSSQAAAHLLQEEAGSPLPSAALEWIEQRAQGNPLYLLEFFRLLARRGELWSDGRAWHWRRPDNHLVPETVEAVIAEHLRAAADTPALRSALSAWAVFPDGVTADVREAVSNLNTTTFAQAVELLRNRGILIGEGFVHPLFREIARRAVEPAERRCLAHRALAAVPEHMPQLAVPLLDDACVPPERAVPLLLRAAQDLDLHGERQHAATLRARAARTADDADPQWRIQLAVQAARVLGSSDLAEAARLTDWAMSLDPYALETVFLKADLLRAAGQTQAARTLLLGVPEERRGVPWLLKRLESLQYPSETAELLDLWAAHPEVNEQGGVALLTLIYEALVRLGRFEEADSGLRQAFDRPDVGDAEVGELLLAQGHLEWYRGDYAAADTAFRRAVGLLKTVAGKEASVAQALRKWSNVLWGLSKHHEARQALEEAVQLSEHRGDQVAVNAVQGVLGALLIEFGAYQQAEDLLLEAAAALRSTALADQLAILHGNLAYLYLEWEPPYGRPRAMMNARTGLQIARSVDSPPVLTQALCFAAWTEARHGSPALARELAEEALILAGDIGQRRSVALASFALANAMEAAGDPHQAQTRYQSAADLMSDLGMETWEQRFLLEIDRLRHRTGDAAARRVYFERLGLANGVSLVDRYFPELESGVNSAVPGARLLVLGPVGYQSPDGTAVALQGRQTKTLLSLLLNARISGRPEVRTATLQNALYPSGTHQDTLSNLHQLVSRVRARLGERVVLTSGSGYVLGDVDSDAEAYLRSGETHWWRGEYMEGLELDTEQVEGVRDALLTALFDSVVGQMREAPQEAVRLARLLLRLEPFDHDVLRLALRALLAAGKDRAAASVYASALHRFAEIGERLPASQTQYLQAGTLGRVSRLERP